jgi:hypothetical protein
MDLSKGKKYASCRWSHSVANWRTVDFYHLSRCKLTHDRFRQFKSTQTEGTLPFWGSKCVWRDALRIQCELHRHVHSRNHVKARRRTKFLTAGDTIKKASPAAYMPTIPADLLPLLHLGSSMSIYMWRRHVKACTWYLYPSRPST